MKHGYCLTGKTTPPSSSGMGTALESILWELELLNKAGYHFAEIDTGMLLSLTDSDVERIKLAALPIEVCNCFIPARYPICEDTQRDALNEYVKTTLARAAELGIKIMVFGSGGARRVPEGMSMEEGSAYIAKFLQDCNVYAMRYGVTVVVEPLNHKECNILLSVSEGARLVRGLNLSHIKLLADTYHMSVDGELACAVAENIDIIEHIHIAEDLTRSYPGSGSGETMNAVADVLKNNGYSKRVTVEYNPVDWESEIALSKQLMDIAF